jgi:predicted Zn-dependent protease with MMP-like domain
VSLESGEPGDSEDPEDTERVTRAFELQGEGEYEASLELLEQVSEDREDRWALACEVFLELGELARADDARARVRAIAGPDDPSTLWTEGKVRLAQWRLDEARAVFARLDVAEEGPPLLEILALLADLDGDADRAHALLQRAHRMDSESYAKPLRLPAAEFEAIVHSAAGELPPDFQAAFEEIAVVIDPMPTAELLGAPQSGHAPDTLGLCLGLPRSERDSGASGEMPLTIFLFQRNLERYARDRAELEEEIRVTLYHELGHALGFDEAGVDEMGLG